MPLAMFCQERSNDPAPIRIGRAIPTVMDPPTKTLVIWGHTAALTAVTRMGLIAAVARKRRRS
jgi:hypothetical protein